MRDPIMVEPPATHGVRARAGMGAWIALVVLLLEAALAGGCGGGGQGAAPTTETKQATVAQADTGGSPSVRFARLPADWRAFDGGGAPLSRGRAAESAFATSWAFDPATGSGPAGALPARGAFITVVLPGRARGWCAHDGGVRVPARLGQMTRAELEGAPEVVEYRYERRLGGGASIDVRVDLAPGADKVAAGDALRAVRVRTRRC